MLSEGSFPLTAFSSASIAISEVFQRRCCVCSSRKKNKMPERRTQRDSTYAIQLTTKFPKIVKHVIELHDRASPWWAAIIILIQGNCGAEKKKRSETLKNYAAGVLLSG